MSRALWTVVVTAALASLGVQAVQAQCTYTMLASGAAATVTATPTPLQFNQSSAFWTAIAIRSAAGSNWDLGIYSGVGGPPNCVNGSLGSSVKATGVDFVVGDFNPGHNVAGIHYPLATRVSGAGSATVEWDDGADLLTVNAPSLTVPTSSSDVIQVWDVFLSAGVTYTISFSRTGADAKALLFKSGAGAYWAGRDSRVLELTSNGTYAATTSGYYGLVVVNDDGVTGSYDIAVGRCEIPTDLVSGVAVSTAGLGQRYYRWDQNGTFHLAVGVRGTANWNIAAFGDRTGSSWPTCFADPLATSSLAAPAVDFIVGNFDLQIPDTSYFVRAFMNNNQGTPSAMVEWDGGSTLSDIVLTDPSNPTISRTTGPSDVLECWDIYLNSGQSYQVFFNTNGADLKLFLFAPSLNWGGRSNAILQRTGSSSAASYVAANTGWHGLVVVNDNGQPGSYDLRVYSQNAVGVGDLPPGVTALERIAPNPAKGPMRIDFSLHAPAPVAFEILDLQGRVVSDIPERQWSAGRWNAVWNGRSRVGGSLSAGVYFVRMRVADRTIALRKFTLLR